MSIPEDLVIVLNAANKIKGSNKRKKSSKEVQQCFDFLETS
jgi:hypothetical protein